MHVIDFNLKTQYTHVYNAENAIDNNSIAENMLT